MRTFLNKKQLRLVTSLSIQHITREEKKGRFPKRIPISTSRVAWDSEEVQAWMDQRKATRDSAK
jgi:prophage regulatory protein